MDGSALSYFSQTNFLSKKAHDNESRLKRALQFAADRLKHYHQYLSKDPIGNLNRAGKILTGTRSQNDNDSLMSTASRDILNWAIISLLKPVQINWDNVVHNVRSFANAISPVYNSQSALEPLSNRYLNEDTVELVKVSGAFKRVVDDYVSESVTNSKVEVNSTFNALNEGYAIPFRANIQEVFNAAPVDHNDNVDAAVAMSNLSEVILAYKGVCFSTEYQEYGICPDKFDELKSAFRVETGLSVAGQSTVPVFASATRSFTPRVEPAHPAPSLLAA